MPTLVRPEARQIDLYDYVDYADIDKQIRKRFRGHEGLIREKIRALRRDPEGQGRRLGNPLIRFWKGPIVLPGSGEARLIYKIEHREKLLELYGLIHREDGYDRLVHWLKSRGML